MIRCKEMRNNIESYITSYEMKLELFDKYLFYAISEIVFKGSSKNTERNLKIMDSLFNIGTYK